MPDWQVRVILPVLVDAARAGPARPWELERVIRDLRATARRRGMRRLLEEIDRKYAAPAPGNGEDPTGGSSSVPSGPPGA